MIQIKSLLLLLLLFCMVSCDKWNKCQQVQNQDLARSILEYDSMIQSKVTGRDYMLDVHVQSLNDSVKRYYVGYTLSSSFIRYDTTKVLYQVGDKDVLFSYYDGALPEDFQRMSEEQCMDIIKKHFPKEYKRLVEHPNAVMPTTINDDGAFILTFYRDKLVDKTLQFVENGPFYKIGNQYFME